MATLYKRPSGTWYVRFREGGKSVTRSLRTKSRKEAGKRFKEYEQLENRGAKQKKSAAGLKKRRADTTATLPREERIRVGILVASAHHRSKDIAGEIGCAPQALRRFLSGGTVDADLLDNSERWLRANGFWFWDKQGKLDETQVNRFRDGDDPWDVALAELQHLVALVRSNIPEKQRLRLLHGSWQCFQDILPVLEEYVEQQSDNAGG